MSFSTGRSSGFHRRYFRSCDFYCNWRLRTERRSGPNEQNGRFQPEIPLWRRQQPAGCDRFFHLHREKPYCKLWWLQQNQYYGITAGPAYRINDWASIYGVVGVGYGKFQTTEYPTYKHDTSDYGFSYGAGLQFNPMENVALDFSYEQSRIRSVDVGTDCRCWLPLLITSVI